MENKRTFTDTIKHYTLGYLDGWAVGLVVYYLSPEQDRFRNVALIGGTHFLLHNMACSTEFTSISKAFDDQFNDQKKKFQGASKSPFSRDAIGDNNGYEGQLRGGAIGKDVLNLGGGMPGFMDGGGFY